MPVKLLKQCINTQYTKIECNYARALPLPYLCDASTIAPSSVTNYQSAWNTTGIAARFNLFVSCASLQTTTSCVLLIT